MGGKVVDNWLGCQAFATVPREADLWDKRPYRLAGELFEDIGGSLWDRRPVSTCIVIFLAPTGDGVRAPNRRRLWPRAGAL